MASEGLQALLALLGGGVTGYHEASQQQRREQAEREERARQAKQWQMQFDELRRQGDAKAGREIVSNLPADFDISTVAPETRRLIDASGVPLVSRIAATPGAKTAPFQLPGQTYGLSPMPKSGTPAPEAEAPAIASPMFSPVGGQKLGVVKDVLNRAQTAQEASVVSERERQRAEANALVARKLSELANMPVPPHVKAVLELQARKFELGGLKAEDFLTPKQIAERETKAREAERFKTDEEIRADQARIAAETRGRIEVETQKAAGVGATPDASVLAQVEQVLDNPDLLRQYNAAERSRILRAMAVQGKNIPNARRQSMATMAQGALDVLKQVSPTAPGFSGAVGAQANVPFWPLSGTDAGNFASLFDSFKARISLPQMEVLRGLGHMSDKEFKAISDAATTLSRNLSEKEYARQYKDAQLALESTIKRVQAGIQVPMEAEIGSGVSSGNTGRGRGDGPGGLQPGSTRVVNGVTYTWDGAGWK